MRCVFYLFDFVLSCRTFGSYFYLYVNLDYTGLKKFLKWLKILIQPDKVILAKDSALSG
jgi:hypothetical protein